MTLDQLGEHALIALIAAVDEREEPSTTGTRVRGYVRVLAACRCGWDPAIEVGPLEVREAHGPRWKNWMEERLTEAWREHALEVDDA